ncbi:MAG TPA: hypothetical protein PK562_05740 [Candidatus Omnitrophota bacterium]|nr:hypothetical protein [Candidatus Omnitrophota bacterium]
MMKRFRNAVNLASPKQPFYYPVSVCNIVSPEVTPGDTESMKRQLMRTEGGGTPNGDCVILNTSTNAEQIRFMPDARTNFELSIESSVPSGRYTIALLCSTDKAVPDLRSLSPLRYRFDSDSPYVASSTYTPFTANQESEEDTQQPYYYYALLSETTVRDNKFSLQIDLRNPAKAPDAIHQIIFFPVNHDTPAKSVRENIDFRERLKKIRLFGYMQ